MLFCLYIDDLLVTLSKSGVGCFIGKNFVGALAYADDIVLVAPTASALLTSCCLYVAIMHLNTVYLLMLLNQNV